MQTLDRDELTVHINAPPDVVYRLVSVDGKDRRSELHRRMQETLRKITAVAEEAAEQ